MAWMQRLRWIATTAAITLAVGATVALPVAGAESHHVQRGDTLIEIAETYGIPLHALAEFNGISNPDLILAGEDVMLPAVGGSGGAGGTSTSETTSYTIEEGDTLQDIAAALGITVEQILNANPEIDDPDQIVIGQTIQVPVGGPTRASVRADVAQLLREHASTYGLDPSLVQALAWQESGWQQDVVSSAGAVGIMQLLPETAEWVSEALVGTTLNVTDSASDNIVAGAAYLSWLLDHTGSERMQIAAYYQGQESVKRDGLLPETEQYVAAVQSIRRYIDQYGSPPPPN